MAIKNGAKHKTLRYLITSFAVEIGFKADKERYNKAWTKLWCGIAKIGLFKDDTQNKMARGGRKKKIEVVESNAIK